MNATPYTQRLLTNVKHRPLCAAIALSMVITTFAGSIYAQDASQSEESAVNLDGIIVTGTRRSGMQAADSPAPIQVVTAEALQESAAPDLMNQLANQVPSFNANQRGGDLAQQTLTAALRALSPNHTLMLINGKRFHVSGNSSATDMAFIPSSAIASVEVLTDGAAALYGSDAIAGVINLITKKNVNGGSVDARVSGYEDGGGYTKNFSGSFGQANENGYWNLAVEKEEREPIMRLGMANYSQCILDPVECQAKIDAARAGTLLNFAAATFEGFLANDSGAAFNPYFPYNNLIGGTGQYDRDVALLSAGYYLGESTEVYGWARFGNKVSKSWQNARRPSQDGGYWGLDGILGTADDELWNHKYPTGFQPKEEGHETDYSIALGITGELVGWNYDLAAIYGKNVMDVYTTDSMNFSLWNEFGYSPEDFYDGSFRSVQENVILSVDRDFQIGLASPMTLAMGLEHRKEYWGIDPGEPASYYGAGAASWAGFAPSSAGYWSQTNNSFYVNAIASPLDNWIVDVAGRYEDFSDLDSEFVFKFTTRYDFNDWIAARFTASTGFRAPGLVESQYTAIGVGPTGSRLDLGGSNPAVGLMGFDVLGPEKSESYSLGFVFNPIPRLTTTIDVYRITLEDRVGSTSFSYSQGQSADSLTGLTTGVYDSSLPDPGDVNRDGIRDMEYNAIIGEYLANLGYIGRDANGNPHPNADYGGSFDRTARANTSVSFQSNMYDTRTQGVDLVATYSTPFSWGRIDWNLSANYNKTKVLDSVVNAQGLPALNDATIWNMENGNLDYRINLGATVRFGNFTATIREQFYGPSATASSTNIAGVANAERWEAIKGDFKEIPSLSSGTVIYYENPYDAMSVTNVELSYRHSSGLHLSIGADNVFSKYPNKTEPSLWEYNEERYNNTSIYKTGHPIGYFGTRWFAKASYNF